MLVCVTFDRSFTILEVNAATTNSTPHQLLREAVKLRRHFEKNNKIGNNQPTIHTVAHSCSSLIGADHTQGGKEK